jgi:NAD(P)H-hydrate epimerase
MTARLRALSREEVRQLDRQAITELMLPSLVLMENAGRGAASWLGELTGALTPDAWHCSFKARETEDQPSSPRGPALPKVLILCGSGNNGGDGAVVARHLNAWGYPVQVIWFCQYGDLRGDARIHWTILQRSGVDQITWFDDSRDWTAVDSDLLSRIVRNADWVVDGLLGTGLSRPVEGKLRVVVEAVNRSGKPIFALDIPSGLDADTGLPQGIAIRACATATFVAAKRGFATAGARDYTGEVKVIDIGLPRCLLSPYLVR